MLRFLNCAETSTSSLKMLRNFVDDFFEFDQASWRYGLSRVLATNATIPRPFLLVARIIQWAILLEAAFVPKACVLGIRLLSTVDLVLQVAPGQSRPSAI